MDGVIYEPHGSHIFHTDDREAWDLVSNLVPFWNYEHTVTTMVRGRKMTWPIQAQEVQELYGPLSWPSQVTIDQEDGKIVTSFETYCLDIMPREVYEDFIKPYTEKQWGLFASDLSAEFAPKRVQVRMDGDKRLFKDEFQGFPDAREGGTYDAMHRALWGDALKEDVLCHRFMELHSTIGELDRHRRDVKAVFITVPLDEFCGDLLGELPWRGLSFEHKLVYTDFVQDRMVVNWPSKEWPFIRTHETKHASRQEIDRTVITTEFTGAPLRYYPVPGKGGAMRELNEKYQDFIRGMLRPMVPRVYFVGRLANFAYYDQDDVIRQALDAARSAAEG